MGQERTLLYGRAGIKKKKKKRSAAVYKWRSSLLASSLSVGAEASVRFRLIAIIIIRSVKIISVLLASNSSLCRLSHFYFSAFNPD